MSTSTSTPATRTGRSSTPEEIVTASLLRLVSVPGLDRPAALITLDNGRDHRRPNTLGPGGLASLDAALDEAFAADPAFVAVTGKPYVFCAGADLTIMPGITTRDAALQVGQLGHRVFARLHDSSVPTFAFVNGPALGGGLELALHCRYRTVSAGARMIALPECSFGLIPGWGGSTLLPKLIGPEAAVKVIVENPLSQNRMLRPEQAHALGIADELFDPADFLECSLHWAAGVVRGEITVERPEPPESAAWRAALARGKAIADAKVRGAAPAPYRALSVIGYAETATLAEGTAVEEETLASLLLTDELRSGLYAFDLVQRRAKHPAGAPGEALAREVTKVGILGAGLMASQIAMLYARRLQVPVVLTDLDQARVDAGVSRVHAEIDALAGRRRIDAGTAARLHGLVSGSVDKAAFADADLVVEAVFEELDVKRAALAEIERIVPDNCVLATNTSALSVTDIAAALVRPERLVGMHFFNPVAVMPLLEVVRAERTDTESLATAFAVGKQLRKSCVLVLDSPGFVVNRVLIRLLNVVFAAVDAGTPVEVAETALDPWGLPMRPFELLQLVGPAVAYHVAQTLHTAYPERFGLSPNIERIVESGKPGIYLSDQHPSGREADQHPSGRDTDQHPSGRDTDQHPSGREADQHPNRQRPAEAAANLSAPLDPQVLALFATGHAPLSTEELRVAAANALGREIQLMLAEGVVAEAADIDLCMILGAGWPFHLGGITPFLRRMRAL